MDPGKRRRWLVIILSLVLTACNSGADPGRADTTETQPESLVVVAATASPSAAQVSAPTPTLESFPSGCSTAEVTALLTRFLDAFNKGDQDQLIQFFPQGQAEDDQDSVSFRYGVGRMEDGMFVREFLAYTPADLPAYFAARHQQQERLELRMLRVTNSAPPGAIGIVFRMTRRADDLLEYMVRGKGAINCQTRTIIAWGMGAFTTVQNDEN